jgi:hypothetical protein
MLGLPREIPNASELINEISVDEEVDNERKKNAFSAQQISLVVEGGYEMMDDVACEEYCCDECNEDHDRG